MEFTDAHEYAAPGHYNCPNENTQAWREGIKGMTLYRAAGICSGGEIGFFSILPTVRRKLVLVDHSYLSLHIAITKYLILAAKGPKETYRLFTEADHAEVRDACLSVEGDIPETVRKCIEQSASLKPGRYSGTPSKYSDWRRLNPIRQEEFYNNATGRYEWRTTTKQQGYAFSEIQNHWKRNISLQLVEQAYKKLHLVKFIHGDLTDLAEDGPYGLIYLSNALEHTSRTGSHPLRSRLNSIKPMLREDGVLVVAGYYERHQSQLQSVKKCVSSDPGHRDTYGWNQSLYRFAKPEAVAA